MGKKKTQFDISIHAPTRGATVSEIASSFAQTISIHAPTRGATVDAMYTGANYDISIHAPTRGATQDAYITGSIPNISIHAPTRGATCKNGIITTGIFYFNPRSHEGSDKPVPPEIGAPNEFQSTLPRGERHQLI